MQSPGKHRRIKPQSVVPFELDENAAVSALRRYLSKQWFAPRSLSRDAQVQGALHGIYVPCWTFDATTRTSFEWYSRNDLRSNLGLPPRTHSETLSNVTFKHMLLPVWIATYQYQSERHMVLVNGQTGAVFGTVPINRARATRAAFGIGAAVIAILWVLSHLP